MNDHWQPWPQKLASPFRTVAVAFAFSPRREAILAEARRLKQLFDARLMVITIGRQSEFLENQLESALINAGLEPEDTTIFWDEGDPVKKIIQICNEENVDLLMAGATRQEGRLKFYLGTVGLEIVRQTSCSVLVMPEPQQKPRSYNRVMAYPLNPEVEEWTMRVGNYVASKAGPQGQLLAGFRLESRWKDNLNPTSFGLSYGQIKEKLCTGQQRLSQYELVPGWQSFAVAGNVGPRLHHLARAKEADLLVVASERKTFEFMDRFMRQDLEYILADLPSDVLILRRS